MRGEILFHLARSMVNGDRINGLYKLLLPRIYCIIAWVVVSNIFYFHPYLGKISNLTNIFFRWVGSTTNQLVFIGKGHVLRSLPSKIEVILVLGSYILGVFSSRSFSALRRAICRVLGTCDRPSRGDGRLCRLHHREPT